MQPNRRAFSQISPGRWRSLRIANSCTLARWVPACTAHGEELLYVTAVGEEMITNIANPLVLLHTTISNCPGFRGCLTRFLMGSIRDCIADNNDGCLSRHGV
jgi:hypothetical protein